MDGSESGNDVVFSSANVPFSEVGAVVVGVEELNNAGPGVEERKKDLTSAEDSSSEMRLVMGWPRSEKKEMVAEKALTQEAACLDGMGTTWVHP
jgi:hypothetical protein